MQGCCLCPVCGSRASVESISPPGDSLITAGVLLCSQFPQSKHSSDPWAAQKCHVGCALSPRKFGGGWALDQSLEKGGVPNLSKTARGQPLSFLVSMPSLRSVHLTAWSGHVSSTEPCESVHFCSRFVFLSVFFQLHSWQPQRDSCGCLSIDP